MLVQKLSMYNILPVPERIGMDLGCFWDRLGRHFWVQNQYLRLPFSRNSEHFWFSKNSTACRREACFGGSRGHTWSFGGLKNDVKWDQKSDGISGPKLGGDLGPTVGAGADPSYFTYEKLAEA